MHAHLRLLALPFLLLAMAGCGGDAADGGPPQASRDLLLGTWKVDFEDSWTRSREAFLADTMRGADAYPTDPAEKERIVKEETQAMVGAMEVGYAADGTTTWKIGPGSQTGTFEVLETKGSTMRVSSTAGQKQEIGIEFASRDEIRWKPGAKGPRFTMRRQKP